MSNPTNGWDAVCAINAANLNQLSRSWYLANCSANGQPGPHIQLLKSSNPGELILDVRLGPAEISFPADGQRQQATVSMAISSGVLLLCDVRQHIVKSAFILQPDVASITGTVDLTRAEGAAALGDVQLNLTAGRYVPVISGLDATSDHAADLGAEIGQFFAENPVSVPLGGVTTSNVPDWLQPKLFEFCVQPNPDRPDDGCVLFFIQTNGTPGQLAPLPTYPIPTGCSASLIVSNEILQASDVETFALQNILLYENSLCLQPDSLAMQPGRASVTFTATLNRETLDSKMYSRQPSRGLSVGPARLTLTAGQSALFTVEDGHGETASVTWSLEPALGSMSQVEGAWIYTAPESIATSSSVTLTATSTTNAADCGSATVMLAPMVSVGITPDSATISPDQTILLTAAAPGLPNVSWTLWPASAGTISVDDRDGFRATFAASSDFAVAWIAAYGTGTAGERVGVGDAWVTLRGEG
jgi:hypothetical protein